MIKSVIDKELQLTIFIFSETITLDAILKEIEHFYATDPTPHTLWNFSNADLSEIHPDQIQGVAEYAKEYAPDRQPGRTALVAGLNHNYAYGRMYETFAEMVGVISETQVFRSEDEAIEWIKSFGTER